MRAAVQSTPRQPTPTDRHSPLVGQAGEGTAAGRALTVEDALRVAHRVMEELGIHLGTRKLHRLVARYIRDGRADVDFRTWFLAYADPTGETAVRNVLRAEASG